MLSVSYCGPVGKKPGRISISALLSRSYKVFEQHFQEKLRFSQFHNKNSFKNNLGLLGLTVLYYQHYWNNIKYYGQTTELPINSQRQPSESDQKCLATLLIIKD